MQRVRTNSLRSWVTPDDVAERDSIVDLMFAFILLGAGSPKFSYVHTAFADTAHDPHDGL